MRSGKRHHWIVPVALAILLAGCAQAPSGGSDLPLPAFHDVNLSKVPVTAFSTDITLSVPDDYTVAVAADNPRLAFASAAGGQAIAADGKSFRFAGDVVLATGGGRVIATSGGTSDANRDDGPGQTVAYDATGQIWSLPVVADVAWVSPDGMRVALHDPAAERLLLLNGATGKILARYRVAPGEEVSFSAEDGMLVNDSSGLFLVTNSGDRTWSYNPGVNVAYRVALSRNGATFYVNTGNGDDTAYAFTADGKKLLWKRRLPAGPATAWAQSRDGSRVALATGSQGGEILVLDASSGSVVGAWALPQGGVVRGMTFNRQGTLWTLVGPADAATPAARGIAAPGSISAGGDTVRAIAWSRGGPTANIAVSGDALLAQDGEWLWTLDGGAGEIRGMDLAQPSEAAPATSR